VKRRGGGRERCRHPPFFRAYYVADANAHQRAVTTARGVAGRGGPSGAGGSAPESPIGGARERKRTFLAFILKVTIFLGYFNTFLAWYRSVCTTTVWHCTLLARNIRNCVS